MSEENSQFTNRTFSALIITRTSISIFWMKTWALLKRTDTLRGSTTTIKQCRLREVHGSQIGKLRPECYKNTERISLVSSFVASLFTSRIVGIDADGQTREG